MKTILLSAALALLAGRLVWLYVIPAWNTIVTDFPNYYVSAWAVRHGESLTELYDPLWFERAKHRAGIERPAALFNYFPPMNALVMWPLADLPPLGAKRAWTALNAAALIAVIVLTTKASGLHWLVSACVGLLAGDALGNNFAFGQFYIVLTLLMLSAAWMARRFPHLAGMALAAGAVTKIFPAFLLVVFAIRREYRALIWSVAALAALTILGLFAMGWTPHGVYLTEVLGRTLRGEIQDPYNVHWNTLQALVRRAFVREEILNPMPIIDAPWLFFFLRPLIGLSIAAATVYAIFRGRRQHILLAYGEMIATISLVTPSQASYHQFLFYPGIAGLIALEGNSAKKFAAAIMFALIGSNAMGATAVYDSGAAMLLAFPRAWLVLALWVMFLFALNPPMPAAPARLGFSAAAVVLLAAGLAFFENRRWDSDVADGAILVRSASSASLDVQPRFINGRLVTSALGPDGFGDSLTESATASNSPDGRWTAFATKDRGNWDVAIRSNQTGEIRYLTSSRANDLTPTFSPDGRFVYFASDRHRGYRFTAIYQVSVDAR